LYAKSSVESDLETNFFGENKRNHVLFAD